VGSELRQGWGLAAPTPGADGDGLQDELAQFN
jgi:hypothetical protein